MSTTAATTNAPAYCDDKSVLWTWVSEQKAAKASWADIHSTAQASGWYTTAGSDTMRIDFGHWKKAQPAQLQGEEHDDQIEEQAQTLVPIPPPPPPAPVTNGLGHLNGTGDIVQQMAMNPTLGQAIALQVYNGAMSDALMAVGLINFGDTQARVQQLKTAWDQQIAGLLKNWSEDGAIMLRSYIRGQRPVVLQLFMSMNRLALASPEARAEVERDVDCLIQSFLGKIKKPEESNRPLAATR